METINLYEGYQEISITEEALSSQVVFKVRLLEFHFSEILNLIPLGQYHVNSVMYNYFRSEGWHNGKWECIRVQEFYDQLLAINLIVPVKYIDVYNALIQISKSTIQNANKLYIELV